MAIEVEIDLTREDLLPEVQIDILIKAAERMVQICGGSPRDSTFALLAAESVIAIRDAPPSVGVAPDLLALMVEAMQIARLITKPPPRAGA